MTKRRLIQVSCGHRNKLTQTRGFKRRVLSAALQAASPKSKWCRARLRQGSGGPVPPPPAPEGCRPPQTQGHLCVAVSVCCSPCPESLHARTLGQATLPRPTCGERLGTPHPDPRLLSPLPSPGGRPCQLGCGQGPLWTPGVGPSVPRLYQKCTKTKAVARVLMVAPAWGPVLWLQGT